MSVLTPSDETFCAVPDRRRQINLEEPFQSLHFELRTGQSSKPLTSLDPQLVALTVVGERTKVDSLPRPFLRPIPKLSVRLARVGQDGLCDAKGEYYRQVEQPVDREFHPKWRRSIVILSTMHIIIRVHRI
jgi:hypothetical protein